jgi:hypothetical protein
MDIQDKYGFAKLKLSRAKRKLRAQKERVRHTIYDIERLGKEVDLLESMLPGYDELIKK